MLGPHHWDKLLVIPPSKLILQWVIKYVDLNAKGEAKLMDVITSAVSVGAAGDAIQKDFSLSVLRLVKEVATESRLTQVEKATKQAQVSSSLIKPESRWVCTSTCRDQSMSIPTA